MSKLVLGVLLLAMTSLGGCVVYDPHYGYGAPGYSGGAYYSGGIYYDGGRHHRHRRRW